MRDEEENERLFRSLTYEKVYDILYKKINEP